MYSCNRINSFYFIFQITKLKYIRVFNNSVGHFWLTNLVKESSRRNPLVTPGARSHLHSAGSPHHASFTAWSSYPPLHGNSSSLGTNVIMPSQSYKHSSGHHFHYSQVNWWGSFTCQRSLMAKVTTCCHIGSQWGRVPMQVRAMKEAWEGQAPAEWRCDLVGGPRYPWHVWLCVIMD